MGQIHNDWAACGKGASRSSEFSVEKQCRLGIGQFPAERRGIPRLRWPALTDFGRRQD